MEINLGNFTYKFLKGEWFWKANNTLFKKNGALKKKNHDLPAYKAIYGIESEVKEEYNKTLNRGIKEIIQNIASSTTK